MEPRLINANDLERYAVYREDGHRYVPWLAIAEVPTAEKTVRGCWVKNEFGYICTACDKQYFTRISMQRLDFKFCPKCGAKMDGGDPDAQE